MLEGLLKILICVFAVFGLYVFAHALGHICFPNRSIQCALLVDSYEVAEQIEFYLDEAKGATLLLGEKRIYVVVMEKYATDELLRFLKRKRISFGVVSDKT